MRRPGSKNCKGLFGLISRYAEVYFSGVYSPLAEARTDFSGQSQDDGQQTRHTRHGFTTYQIAFMYDVARISGCDLKPSNFSQ